jgi:hypothetical protein
MEKSPIRYLLLAPALAATMASWLHYAATGQISIYASFLREPPLVALNLALLVFALAGGSWMAWRAAIPRGPFALGALELRGFGYASLLLSSAMLPLTSNDLFCVLGYGDAALQGMDVYLDPDTPARSVFAPYIDPLYLHLACKYGPFNVMLSETAVWLGGGDVWGAVLAYKLLTIAAGTLYLESVLRLAQRNVAGDWAALALFAPLWWFQGIGQQHNDLFGVALIAAGLLALREKRYALGWAAFGLAFLSKITFIVLLPLPFGYALVHERFAWWAAVRKSLVGAALFLGLSVLCYGRYLDSPAGLLAPLTAMGGERPTSTLPDVLGYAAEVLGTPKEAAWKILVPLFQLIGLAALVFLGIRALRHLKRFDEAALNEQFAQFLVVFVSLYSHRFLPWYFMALLPLLAFRGQTVWLRWLLVSSTLAALQDAAHIPSNGTFLGQAIVAVMTVLTLVSFFWQLPRRFALPVSPAGNDFFFPKNEEKDPIGRPDRS